MSSEVVKYHNDFNQVYLGKLNAGELNLAFDIIARVKDKGTDPITFTAAELKKNLPSNYSQHEFSNLITSLRRKFFKVDFTVIIPIDAHLEEERTTNLFRRLSIFRDPETKEVIKVTIQVDEYFKYLVNDIKVSFTRFELEELFQIRGAYAKKLFRLLKQYRHTGECTITWDECCKQVGIPERYSQTNINKRILNPAVAELSEVRTVNGEERPTFKGLAFQKLATPGRGRKITAIRFTWEPEERWIETHETVIEAVAETAETAGKPRQRRVTRKKKQTAPETQGSAAFLLLKSLHDSGKLTGCEMLQQISALPYGELTSEEISILTEPQTVPEGEE